MGCDFLVEKGANKLGNESSVTSSGLSAGQHTIGKFPSRMGAIGLDIHVELCSAVSTSADDVLTISEDA